MDFLIKIRDEYESISNITSKYLEKEFLLLWEDENFDLKKLKFIHINFVREFLVKEHNISRNLRKCEDENFLLGLLK